MTLRDIFTGVTSKKFDACALGSQIFAFPLEVSIKSRLNKVFSTQWLMRLLILPGD
jgi:hypothetical protein